MGGEINFAALEIVCEIAGVADIESVVKQLIVIRDARK